MCVSDCIHVGFAFLCIGYSWKEMYDILDAFTLPQNQYTVFSAYTNYDPIPDLGLKLQWMFRYAGISFFFYLVLYAVSSS